MEVILTTDVPKVGYKGDIVKVRPGFARNFLIPNQMALVANDSNRKRIAEDQRQAAHKVEQVRTNAVAMAEELGKQSIVLKARTGTTGKIFGSITTLQIAQALKEQGFEVDRRRISLVGDIKELGQYQAVVDLHRDVKATLNLLIEAEG